MDEEFWDGMYGDSTRVWSGAPNGTLVAEVDGLPVGRALDVGSGEGADAIWLARQGWQVTGIDISSVALERAREAAAAAGVSVTWQHGDPVRTPFEEGSFDLVSLQYFPLPYAAGPAGLHNLLDAVAMGGTLLVVSHDLSHWTPEQHGHGDQHGHGSDSPEGEQRPGPDPTEYYDVAELAELLGEGWTIEVHETRERPHAPQGNPHIDDVVLRARRTG